MENIVPIDKLADFTRDIVLQIQIGLAKARTEGTLLVNLPKEIQVTCTVIAADGFQAMQLLGGEITERTETQGGENTETRTALEVSERNGSRNATDTTSTIDHSGTDQAYNQTEETTTTYSEVS